MKLVEKMEHIDQKIPVTFAEVNDEVINYAYLLYRLDNLTDLIQKKYKVENRLVTKDLEARNGLSLKYRTIFTNSLRRLENEQQEIQKQIEESTPKLVASMATHCSKYLIDKEIVVNGSYNCEGEKKTIKIPDPKIIEEYKNFFKYVF